MRLIRDLQRKKKVEQKKKVAKGVAMGTLVGGILGSAAGILFAPDSGKNTRKKIQDGAIDAKNNIEKNVAETKETIGTKVKSSREKITEAIEKVKKMRECTEADVAVCQDQEAEAVQEAEENSK